MAREALAKGLCASEDVSTPTTWDHLSDWRRSRYRERADAILASPALDAIAAERVAALAEDEAALSAVWDAMESHGHNGIECRPEKPMDYTAVYVIHALAAVLAGALDERSQP